jgi:DNA-binding HxlR family transcriptional regulator
LLIVRELLLGPKRFTDLRAGLPNVSPDILAQRLRDLEQSGIVRRGKLPPPAASRIYELTDRGRELEPVLLALGRWGSRAPFPAVDADLSVDAFAVALKTVFDPRPSDGLHATYELRLSDQRFEAAVADGSLTLLRGSVADPVATIETDPRALSAVLWHERPLDDAISSGDLRIAGDRRAAERLLALFPPPRP